MLNIHNIFITKFNTVTRKIKYLRTIHNGLVGKSNTSGTGGENKSVIEFCLIRFLFNQDKQNSL